MLELAGVCGGYGGAPVLDGIDLRVAQGEAVALLGPNGAGKSTLLAALSGVLPVREGRALMDGADLMAMPSHRIVAHGLVQVPEGRRVFAPFPVEDNLRLGTVRLRAKGRGALAERFEAVYSLFPRLAERRRQLAGTLSGGEQQMLAIGRALMGGPRLLLLDEPSLGLSPLLARQVLSALSDLNREGLTILLVEQNARAALRATKHAYVLEQGKIVHHGPSHALAQDPEVISHYLGQAGGSKAPSAGNAQIGA